MRVIDKSKRPGRVFTFLLVAAVLAIMVAGGLGLLRRDFLRKVRHAPYATLVEQPLRSLKGRAEAARLPQMRVNVKFEHYDRLLAKREEALRQGILQTSDGDFVPAKIDFEGETLSAKLRLKGDWPDHFETDKWSFRIHLKGDGQILGMTRFSLQHPTARNFVAEWAFFQTLRHEDILTPRYRFVRFNFNGEDRGIMALEEHFAKELLESQRRREGPIAKLDEAPLWEQRRSALNDLDLDFKVLDQLNYRSARVDFFGGKKIAADPVMNEQAQGARRLMEAFQNGTLPPDEIFDLERMADFLALCRIWGADHALFWHNLRFYYDPIGGRLEPIAFDGEPSQWKFTDMWRTHLMGGFQVIEGHDRWFDWVIDLLEDERFTEAYLTSLHRFTRPAYVDEVRARLGAEVDRRVMALHTEWPDLENPLDTFVDGAHFVAGKLSPTADLRARWRAGGKSISIEATNVADVPMEVLGAESGGQRWLVPERLILDARGRRAPLRWRRLELPSSFAESDTITLLYRTLAGEEDREITVLAGAELASLSLPLPDAPSAVEIAAVHSFLSYDAEVGELRLAQGSWDVSSDLILPVGIPLVAEGPVSLRFDENALLLARGPLRFEGTDATPIQLLPLAENWPGLVVLGADETSVLRNVRVEATRGISRPGWILTGGVTFYESRVELSKCVFTGHQGEDALNIVRADFSMTDCILGDCAADAFDGDFVTGTIRGTSFHDVGGDALDVSGAHLEIQGMRAQRIADKAISIGENSRADVYDLEVDGASIAVAAKDLSEVFIQAGRIRDARIGLAAFIKKPTYGPASIEAEELVLESVQREVLLQLGSTIRWNHRDFEAVELNVDELYSAGILGN